MPVFNHGQNTDDFPSTATWLDIVFFIKLRRSRDCLFPLSFGFITHLCYYAKCRYKHFCQYSIESIFRKEQLATIINTIP